MEILGGFLTLLSYTELLQLVLLTASGGMVTKKRKEGIAKKSDCWRARERPVLEKGKSESRGE
jgi:hypothetical protein